MPDDKKPTDKGSDDDGYQDLLEEIFSQNPRAILVTEYRDALIGIMYRSMTPPVALYDVVRCTEIIAERDSVGMDAARESVVETATTYLGAHSPAFAVIRRTFVEVDDGSDQSDLDGGSDQPDLDGDGEFEPVGHDDTVVSNDEEAE